MSHLSASFCATIRVRLADAPGSFARLAQAIGDAGGSLGAIDLVRVERRSQGARRDGRRRPTPSTSSGSSRPSRALDGVEVEHVSDRTFLCTSAARSRCASKVAAQDARRPLDGLHARASRGSAGDRRRLADAAWNLTIKREHRRRRQRRHRGARPRRHRARGRDAGDGGQGGAVQGVRRRRRVADLPGDEGRRRDRRRRRRRSRPASAGSTSRTSRRRAASRSSAGCGSELDIPVFHDDQHGTAIVVLAALAQRAQVVGKRLEDVRIVLTGVGRRRDRRRPTSSSTRARGRSSAAIARAPSTGAAPARRGQGGVRRADEPGGRAGHAGRGARGRRRLPRPLGARRGHARRASTTMADGAIVFAMANPTPEVAPGRPPAGLVAVVATGPLRLPEPDQQRARLPGRLPRRARRPRLADHRGR